MVESRRKILYPDVSDGQWNDWKWQVKNRVETLEELKKYINQLDYNFRSNPENAIIAVTDYYDKLNNADL